MLYNQKHKDAMIYIQLYVWVVAIIANFYQKSSKHASSYIDYIFSSNMMIILLVHIWSTGLIDNFFIK